MANFTMRAADMMNHLVMMVQDHQERFGDPDADGDFTVSWEPDGWWLSIVCPGHYAFEREGQPDLEPLLAEAVDYYGRLAKLWDGGRGCQEQHPMRAFA